MDFLFHRRQMALRVTLLALIFLLGACVRHEIELKDQVIAKVNGEPLYAAEFLIGFEQLKAEQDELTQKNPKVLEQLKLRALNEVIIVSLLRQEATKRQVKVAKEEIEGRLANWKDGYPPGGFEEMLKKRSTTETFLKHRIEDQMLVEKLSETLFGTEAMVSDDEVKSYFSQHEKEFVRPERIHVFQIVVPTKEEAEKIRQDISTGKTAFESAARTYSLSPDASKGGDLGFFAKNEKIAAFNEAFNLQVGQLSKPIQSPYGVHLLKAVEKRPSVKLGFQEAKSDIVRLLKRDKEVRAYKEWVSKLLKDGEIHRNDALFAKIS